MIWIIRVVILSGTDTDERKCMKFELTQYRFFRKLYKGNWYLVVNQIVLPFWTNNPNSYKSCGGYIASTEQW